MNKNPYKISIVISVYNRECTLKKCLDSVISQTIFNDMEIILIDDGSTDNSLQICNDYASKWDNIVLIHKENEGMGKSYNLGISLAKGDYIGIVETDDWLESNMYELLYQNAILYNSDLVKCGYYYNEKNKDKKPKIDKVILEKITKIKQPFTIFDNDLLMFYHSSIWACLYKSELIKQIKFTEEPDAAYQDFSFMIKVLVNAKRITAINEYLYHWCIDTVTGQSSNLKDDKNIRMVDQIIHAKNFLTENNLLEKLFPSFYKAAISTSMSFMYRTSPEYREKFFNRLCEFFHELDKKDLYLISTYINSYEFEFLFYIISGKYEEFDFRYHP